MGFWCLVVLDDFRWEIAGFEGFGGRMGVLRFWCFLRFVMMISGFSLGLDWFREFLVWRLVLAGRMYFGWDLLI